jgi:serine protease
MLRPRTLLLACLLAALPSAASTSGVAQAQAQVVARAAQFDDTGAPSRGAPAGGWAAAQWDLTGPFGIRAPEAWAAMAARGRTPGQGVTVAVLDTGVAYRDAGPYRRSPDLSAARVVRGRDFVTPRTAPYDRNGHGTFVAATIAATPGNGYGMVGVAYGARIMPVRVLNGAGNGSAARVARGMRWAVDHGADVLNVSIELYDRGSTDPVSITSDPLLRDAVSYAARHGAVVVAAAGNSESKKVP